MRWQKVNIVWCGLQAVMRCYVNRPRICGESSGRESDGLRRLLAAFERVLPLRKPSDLARRDVVQFVLAASGGLTGEISTLLNDAAELSIRSGDECIEMRHLEHVARITQ
jgi:hypothetical protein